MWLVFLLVLVFAAYGIFEYRRHRFNISQIQVRVHVNGTRGKSSVTRLIGGGLKGGGKRVFIKTTGTSPRTIDVDGNERAIKRIGSANIIEQLKIARNAVAENADYFVVECMALIPQLQYITERQMIKSQVGVITNIREDHLDVMGPTVKDVGEALCNSIPKDSILFTAEKDFLDIIQRRAAEIGTKVVATDPASVSDEELRGFSYLEHKENVALALAVCRHLGVDKESALRGMYAIQPDPGALHKYKITVNSNTIEFINAFAANDPDSYRAIWKMLHLHKGNEKKLIVLVNSRRDRIQRAEQLGEFIARELEADYFVVSGEATRPLVNKAIKIGLPAQRIKDLGGQSVVEVFNYISSLAKQDIMVIGIGNIVGLGDEIVRYFANKGRMVA